jgi:hypothetical protein
MSRSSVLLPQPRRPDNRQELPSGDVKIDAGEDRLRAERLSEATQR